MCLCAPCSDRDGRFTLEEIGAFVDLARERSKAYAPHEFTAQMQGYCSIQLWKWASAPGGAPAFEDWCVHRAASLGSVACPQDAGPCQRGFCHS
jgi:hypothetical protein